MAAQNMNLERLVEAGEEKGFEVEQDVDFGAGPIDVVWNINVHPALPNIKFGFIVLGGQGEGGSQDTEDNQLSLRKIEEAAFRGIRSGLDKVYLITENDEMAKSVSGKIEWLASHGSLIRLDAISLGLYPEQQASSVITPSQQRVPEGEKIRKQDEKEREVKFDKYNRPQGERRDKESEEERTKRELKFDENSRPKGQKKVLED
ncbi:MAG: hypothetical protein ACJ71B_08450 [Nitrososphaera sp.]